MCLRQQAGTMVSGHNILGRCLKTGSGGVLKTMRIVFKIISIVLKNVGIVLTSDAHRFFGASAGPIFLPPDLLTGLGTLPERLAHVHDQFSKHFGNFRLSYVYPIT